jgi:hypothetical protein
MLLSIVCYSPNALVETERALMTVSNGSNPRQAAQPFDQADPSRASANPAAPKFPRPDEPFWAVIWAIAFVIVIAFGVLSGMTNPVEWLIMIVLATPVYFLVVLVMSVPCLWLYYSFFGLCRWLIKFARWLSH